MTYRGRSAHGADVHRLGNGHGFGGRARAFDPNSSIGGNGTHPQRHLVVGMEPAPVARRRVAELHPDKV